MMEPLTFFSLFVTLVFCVFICYHWSRRKFYFCAMKLQGAFAWPIVGNGLKFMCKHDDFLKSLDSIMSPYSSPVRIWLGHKFCVVIKDADQLKIVLTSSKIADKAFFYRFAQPFLGNGLFTAPGHIAKSHRKIFQPFFSQKNVDCFSSVFQKHANNLVKVIEKHVDGPEFDISYYAQQSALEATLDVLIDDKNDELINIKEIPSYIRRFYNIFFARIGHFWLHADFFFERTSLFKEQKELLDIANTAVNKIFDARLPELVHKIQNGEQLSDEMGASSMIATMIYLHLENSNFLSIQECIQHFLTFMATVSETLRLFGLLLLHLQSQDTQASIISFTCMMLATHPHIQDLVLEELKDVLGDRTSLNVVDIPKLKYLDMCIKETLRLFPIAPFIVRHATEDFPLQSLTIPKGTTVFLSFYHIHRDPNHWEKPNDFYPEHFTSEAVSKRHCFAYIPYSAGQRRCIAQDFASMNMKIVLSSLLLRYEIQSSRKYENIKLTSDLYTRPVGGYMVKVKRRSFKV